MKNIITTLSALTLVVPALALLLLSSCSTKSNVTDVPYFQNSREVFPVATQYQTGSDSQQPSSLPDLLIRPKDALNVFVHSKDEDAVAELNLRERQGMDPGKNALQNTQSGFYFYLVDNDGNIEYPLIGKVHVLGMTVEQAAQEIRNGLSAYFHDDPSLTINVRIANFYISVLGEVKRPQTFDVTRPRITLLEALAMAGDLTIYGKRDNVKLLRQQDNGDYEIHELDLRDASIINSPYYYLQQRDIVYVEPNEVQAENTRVGQTTRLWVRGASITISLGSLLYRVLQ